jgi:hypothetical protein
MPQTRLYPRGNALTDSVQFIDRDGIAWLVYVEGIPLAPQTGWRTRARIPGRTLRFDSFSQSRLGREVPAGAPYLRPDRLQELLDGAHSADVEFATPASAAPHSRR